MRTAVWILALGVCLLAGYWFSKEPEHVRSAPLPSAPAAVPKTETAAAAPIPAPAPMRVPSLPSSTPAPAPVPAAPPGTFLTRSRIALEEALDAFALRQGLPEAEKLRLAALLREELNEYGRDLDAWFAGQRALHPGKSDQDLLWRFRELDEALHRFRDQARARYTPALRGAMGDAAWRDFWGVFRDRGYRAAVDAGGRLRVDWDASALPDAQIVAGSTSEPYGNRFPPERLRKLREEGGLLPAGADPALGKAFGDLLDRMARLRDPDARESTPEAQAGILRCQQVIQELLGADRARRLQEDLEAVLR